MSPPQTAPAGSLDRAVHAVSHASSNCAAIALFLIMLMTTVDVVSRNLLDRSVPGLIESSEVMLVIGAFLGLAYGQRSNCHVSTTLLIERLPPRAARVLKLLGLFVVTLYIGFAAVLSALRAWQSFKAGEVRFGLIELVQWPARAAIAIGFALLCAEIVLEIAKTLRAADGLRDGY